MQSLKIFWCSDPALGNAAEVAAALAAWVAAIGTVGGVLFAYRRYRDSLEDKRREQARFVHSYFDDYVIVEAQGTLNAIHRAPRLNLPEGFTLLPYVQTEQDPRTGAEYSRALKRLAFCKVTVENRSDEIVRHVYGQLSVWHATENGRRTKEIGAWDAFPYLLPKKEQTFWVAVPYEGPEDSVPDVIDPMLYFTDANGRTWHRSPFGPPTLVEEEEQGTGSALPMPEKEKAEPRDWSEDELREAVATESGADPSTLVLTGREGRGATFMSEDTVYTVQFALDSDRPLVTSHVQGPEVIEYLKRRAKGEAEEEG